MVNDYKYTEAGLIPNDWEVAAIEEISKVKSGKRLPVGKSLVKTETPYPYIRVTDMQPGGVVLSEIMYVPEEVFPSIRNYRIYEDDIFISVAGTLGIVGKVPKSLDGANLTENADRLTEITCNRDYLLYVLSSWIIQNRIEAEKTLGAQPKLALTRIRKFSIPIPNQTEQNAIAEKLNDVTLLIDGLDTLIAKKRDLRKGVMQELLKPKEDWEEKTLGEVATLKARIGWQGLTTAEYRKTGNYYLITGTEFEKGFVDWGRCFYVDEERYKQDKNIQVRENDVLVTKDGTIGKIALIKSVPRPATLNSGVFVIRPIDESFHPEFLYYLLLSEIFSIFLSQLSAGSTINHLYQKDFVTFKFFTPKTIARQKEIAQILSEIDKEIQELDDQLTKYRMLKQGMMQSLLTGKIRLI